MISKEVKLNIVTVNNGQFNCSINVEIATDRNVNDCDIEKFFNQNKFITLNDGYRLNTEFVLAYKILL